MTKQELMKIAECWEPQHGAFDLYASYRNELVRYEEPCMCGWCKKFFQTIDKGIEHIEEHEDRLNFFIGDKEVYRDPYKVTIERIELSTDPHLVYLFGNGYCGLVVNCNTISETVTRMLNKDYKYKSNVKLENLHKVIDELKKYKIVERDIYAWRQTNKNFTIRYKAFKTIEEMKAEEDAVFKV